MTTPTRPIIIGLGSDLECPNPACKLPLGAPSFFPTSNCLVVECELCDCQFEVSRNLTMQVDPYWGEHEGKSYWYAVESVQFMPEPPKDEDE